MSLISSLSMLNVEIHWHLMIKKRGYVTSVTYKSVYFEIKIYLIMQHMLNGGISITNSKTFTLSRLDARDVLYIGADVVGWTRNIWEGALMWMREDENQYFSTF